MKKFLTIFTPTFNRAYCIGQLYESLTRQTSNDFLWLVIDDGSSDNTKALVDGWISEKKIDIRYIFKENEGMHSGHNVAYDNIDTELNMCIDSDDFLPDNAVEKIVTFWKEHRKPNWAGLLGLDAFKDGSIVGTPFPKGMTECKYSELSSKHKVIGDKKFVYSTEIIKKYPAYPIFKEEKFVPLGYKYMLIDQDYDLGVMHDVLCIIEYLPDGSSKNIFKQYRRHPKGFLYERKIRMVYAPTAKERFINAAHYVSSAIFLRNYRFLGQSTNKGMTLLAIPLGILLNLYIRHTSKTGITK
jgi:glycosyltransferase involved in cell wall biosynthesis